MEVKLEAGARLDFLTKDEVRAELRAWGLEITRGIKFKQFSATVNLTAATFTIGGFGASVAETLGPAPGFVWAVTRVAMSGAGFLPAADSYSVFIDEITASKFVVGVPGVAASTAAHEWNVPGLILNGGERLAVSGGSTGVAGTPITLSGQAVELPVQLAWQLL